MKFVADLHLHSKYSRATAKNLDFENLYHTALLKGVQLIGTGDFTHPAWIEEIKTKLEPAEPGLFALKKEFSDPIDLSVPAHCRAPVRFILQTEISSIYKKNGKVRKNHNLVYFPDLSSVQKFNAVLDAIGNIKSDGRPILGLDARRLLEIMLETCEEGMFIPAHIWTPWFSMFGSKSGFDCMAECFEDLTHHLFAAETGLSSDPPMNWRVKDLDGLRLISSSDAHSPAMLGRNASVFDTDLSYNAIRRALDGTDPEGYNGTLDMYPHMGKYHFDGHRKCGVCFEPEKTAEADGICPVCGRMLTLGVLYRVQELAGRPEGYKPEGRHGFQYIIPLPEMLSEILGVGPKTKKVSTAFNRAILALGPELDILLARSLDDIESAHIPLLTRAIDKMRSGDVHIEPGYDGEYGKVALFTEKEKQTLKGEKQFLFKLPEENSRTGVSFQKKTGKSPVAKSLVNKSGNGKLKVGTSGPAAREKSSPGTLPSEKPEDLLGGLNPEQKSVIESDADAIVVQAGPGTGKTRTLTAKIAWLVSEKKVDPDVVLALTFTNKAAAELQTRIQSYLPKNTRPVLAATFHAFCLGLLKIHEPGFSDAIMDDDTRLSVIREALGGKPKQQAVKKTDTLISLCKQNLRGWDDDLAFLGDSLSEEDEFRTAYRQYQQICSQERLLDFEELIVRTVRILENDEDVRKRVLSACQHVFIDEYQDLNFGQYTLARILAEKSRILVIGDPDQSIYGFRGSDNRYFKQFESDFPGCEKIVLTRNYRSGQTILDASFQMISKADDGSGSVQVFSGIDRARHLIIKPAATEQAEAVRVGKMIEGLMGGTSFFSMDTGRFGPNAQTAGQTGGQKDYSFQDFAVLYRTRRQCQTFVDIFDKAGIPYQTADRKRFTDTPGMGDFMGLLQALCDTAATDSCPAGGMCRFNKGTSPLEGLPPALVSELRQTAAQQDLAAAVTRICELAGPAPAIRQSKGFQDALEVLRTVTARHTSLQDCLNALALNKDADVVVPGVEKVSLMTLHAAKGLEFPVVFVTGCEKGLIPFARDGVTVENMEEERRLFYVGMTRAMDILCLTYAQKRRIYGGQEKRQRSFFIDDIEKKLLQIDKNTPMRPVKKAPVQLELF